MRKQVQRAHAAAASWILANVGVGRSVHSILPTTAIRAVTGDSFILVLFDVEFRCMVMELKSFNR